MEYPEIKLDQAARKMHSRIYQWSARQFDQGWVMDVGSELGVGISLMQAENADIKLIGCDVNFSSLQISRSLSGVIQHDKIQAYGSKLPLAAEFLSGVCLINLLHLVNEPQDLLAESYRTLKYTGKVIVFVDLSKLPLRWESNQLVKYLDDLLGSTFHLRGSKNAFTTESKSLLQQEIARNKIYLRVGEKR